jgi:hypothetical protein
VHGLEIQQDNLKSQIQSAIVDLETEMPQDFKVKLIAIFLSLVYIIAYCLLSEKK